MERALEADRIPTGQHRAGMYQHTGPPAEVVAFSKVKMVTGLQQSPSLPPPKPAVFLSTEVAVDSQKPHSTFLSGESKFLLLGKGKWWSFS